LVGVGVLDEQVVAVGAERADGGEADLICRNPLVTNDDGGRRSPASGRAEMSP
jgi:hypothetical protein